MIGLRYYCQAGGDHEILRLLADLKTRHGVSYEVLDLSAAGEYDARREKQIYEEHFKPRARVLKRRTKASITRLRSRKGQYFVSMPGTIAVVRDGKIEWYTLTVLEIKEFLQTVLARGPVFLEECCS